MRQPRQAAVLSLCSVTFPVIVRLRKRSRYAGLVSPCYRYDIRSYLPSKLKRRDTNPDYLAACLCRGRWQSMLALQNTNHFPCHASRSAFGMVLWNLLNGQCPTVFRKSAMTEVSGARRFHIVVGWSLVRKVGMVGLAVARNSNFGEIPSGMCQDRGLNASNSLLEV